MRVLSSYFTSTAATILKGVGSVGLSLIFWALGLLIAGSQLAVYMELASYFPNRSGAEVVYLEQGYPRPKYLLPTAFAVQSVLLSFSSSNAIGNSLHRFVQQLIANADSNGSIFICRGGQDTNCLGTQGIGFGLYHFHYSL